MEVCMFDLLTGIIYEVSKDNDNPFFEPDSDKYNLCLDCLACPQRAIKFINGKIQISKGKCKKCGACIKICKNNAISLDFDYPYYIQTSSGMKIESFLVCKTELCNGCLKCVKICPNKAIDFCNKYVHFDYFKCKHCNKCIDICPKKAILEVDKLRCYGLL